MLNIVRIDKIEHSMREEEFGKYAKPLTKEDNWKSSLIF